MATKPKGPMGLSTKILLGSAAFGALAIFFPDAIFYVAIAVSIMFVFLWWSRTKGQKSGRLILPMLLVGMPWGIFEEFYQGVAAGEHVKEGFFMNSLTYGAMAPWAIYFVYLLFLFLIDIGAMAAGALAEGRQQYGPPPKEEPGPLSKYWWI